MKPLESAFVIASIMAGLIGPILTKSVWALLTWDKALMSALCASGEIHLLILSSIIGISALVLGLVIEGGHD